ncbi:MAG: hypothetical protein NC110_04385 [Ruminococcus sp.]|nr:hypothetical protein [Ruminococcus sp.]
MTKKQKTIKIAAISLCGAAMLCIVSVLCTYVIFVGVHHEIIKSKPDVSGWVLSSNEYTIVPKIDDNVTFTVKDKSDKTVFECKESWRAWDFNSVNIDAENNIVADSSDTGKQYYIYSSGKWMKSDSPN